MAANGVAAQRKPLVLYAVIDNSGSMSSSCGESKGTEKDGYSRLDLVKHSLNTIISSLSAQDQICIINFNSVGHVFDPLTSVTEDHKTFLISKLKGLDTGGSTNTWDGIRLAIDSIASLRKDQCANRNVQIYVLTDGQNTENPPKTIPEMTVDYLDTKCPAIHPVINTYGYGNELESDMLLAVAQAGNGGSFGFIPDSSLVGTIFINALSNTLMQGAVSDKEREALNNDPLFSSISKAFVASLKHILESPENQRFTDLELFTNKVRTQLCDLNASDPHFAKHKELLEGLLLDCLPNTDDALGQIHKACDSQYFDSWGRHYLRSVWSAYECKMCINFKDRGMQAFKTTVFTAEQQRVEDVFVQLPPPQPSIKVRTYDQQTGQYYYQAAAAPISMASYYNYSGGCFTGDSLVFGEGRTEVPVQNLHKGSVVLSQAGYTQVEAVIKLRYKGPLYPIAAAMKLTAYHPVMLNGECFFPVDHVNSVENVDGYVYDVVLQNRGILACPSTVGELFVATFGHNVSAQVFRHSYFGDEAIVNDLKKHPDWESGFVVLDEPEFVRDSRTQEVVQLVF